MLRTAAILVALSSLVTLATFVAGALAAGGLDVAAWLARAPGFLTGSALVAAGVLAAWRSRGATPTKRAG